MIRDAIIVSYTEKIFLSRWPNFFFEIESNRQSTVASLIKKKKKMLGFKEFFRDRICRKVGQLFDLSTSIWTDSFWHEVTFAVPLHQNCSKFSRSDYSWNIRGFQEYEERWSFYFLIYLLKMVILQSFWKLFFYIYIFNVHVSTFSTYRYYIFISNLILFTKTRK